MCKEDKTLESLLDLDGLKYVIDEHLGLWVKFDVQKIEQSQDRPHGIRYSLTLHDRFNARIMGFDNAHVIEYGGKKTVLSKRTYDHWHRDGKDRGQPYNYKNAGKLVEDFWREVEKRLKKFEEIER